MPAVSEEDRPRKSRVAMQAVDPSRPRKSRASMAAVPMPLSADRGSPLALADPQRSLSALEDDGELNEKTVVGVSLSDLAPVQPVSPYLLKVLQGADTGRQIELSQTGTLIGRGDGCDLQLQDGAASRRHAEIRVAPRGVILRDLGSGNGTTVNNQRIPPESEFMLQDGDLITIGLTVIELVDSLQRASAPAAPSRRPPPRGSSAFDDDALDDDDIDAQIAMRRNKGKKPPFQLLLEHLSRTTLQQRLIVGGVILGIALIYAGHSAYQTHVEEERLAAIKLEEDTLKAREQQYDLALRDGKKAIHDRRPSDALVKFQEARELFPDRVKELDRYIATAERDQKAEVQIKKVKALQAEGRFEEALAGLQEVDTFSSISELVQPLRDEIEKQQLDTEKKEIRRLLEEREIDEARDRISALPNIEIPIFMDLLEEAEKQAKIEEATSARQARTREQERKRQAQQRRQAEITQAIAPIVAKIDRADFKGAQKMLDKFNTRGKPSHVVSKITAMRKALPKLQKDYTQGNSQYLGKNYERAAEPLARAWKTWKSMGISGKLGDKIYAQAGEALENKGRMAMQRKDYVSAGKAFKETLRFNRNSKVASNGLNEIIRKATDIFHQGYTEMGSNPARARQLFEQVIAMTPSDSEVHQKALSRKRTLEKGF